MKTFSVGDRVQYTAEFLRSAGFYTGPVPFARGTVAELETWGRSGSVAVRVEWESDEAIPPWINAENLEKIRS